MFSRCDTCILTIVVEIKYFSGTAVLNMSVTGDIHSVFLTRTSNFGAEATYSRIFCDLRLKKFSLDVLKFTWHTLYHLMNRFLIA